MSLETRNLGVGFSKMMEEYLEEYFAFHQGDDIPPGLYHRVLDEVEQTLFKVALKYSKGNNLKAAQILGINRNTLRRKIGKSRGEENI
ncbi:MAG: Fis family transcriptional regulator [Holosporaceae bacterium]|jgi:DNA-binding protein Fis|nr:Fis family transcriptional regulator [Holosporaceae bacterium]